MGYNHKQYNKNRDEKLGFDLGRARVRLAKEVQFMLIQKAGMGTCYRCGQQLTPQDVSIDHKIGFTNSENPEEMFFDLTNIAFSHLACNMAHKEVRAVKHGTEWAYNKGCRCDICVKRRAEYVKDRKSKKL